MLVETPEDNLPLLNDYIGVIDLLPFHPELRTRMGFDPPEEGGKALCNSGGANPAVAADHQD